MLKVMLVAAVAVAAGSLALVSIGVLLAITIAGKIMKEMEA